MLAGAMERVGVVLFGMGGVGRALVFLLSTACCLLSAFCCLMFGVCCLPSAVCCLLSAT
jgi:homoserine dehydrogenase